MAVTIASGDGSVWPIVDKKRDEQGFTLAALMLSIAILGILATVGFPVWSHITLRDKEKELIFRGERYALAIKNFTRANQGAYPSSLDQLFKDERNRYIRRLWADPLSEEDEEEWGLVYLLGNQYVKETGEHVGTKTLQVGAKPGETGIPAAGQPQSIPQQKRSKLRGPRIAKGRSPIVGVYSKVDRDSLMNYKGNTNSSEWVFISDLIQVQPIFPPKGPQPGQPGLPGQPGQQGLPGQPPTAQPKPPSR